MNTFPVKIRECGQLTIPQSVREQWATQAGDVMTLVQFDDFVVLAPANLKTPSLAQEFSQIMDEEGVSLVDLLEGLQAERQKSVKLKNNEVGSQQIG